MKRVTICSICALLTFLIGVGVAKLSSIKSQPTLRATIIPSLSISAPPPPNCEPYFQIGEDERRVGVRHYVVLRSDYSNILARLVEFVQLHGKTRRNNFYVSKIATENGCTLGDDDACRYAYAYWKEDNSILVIESPFDKEDGTYFELTYFGSIDLAKNVVPTWKEVGTTNYLIPKAEAERLMRECKLGEMKVTIELTRSGAH